MLGAVSAADDDAPSLTHVVLVSLPPELLSRLLGFVPECWYTAHYRAAGAPIPPDATHSDGFVVLLPAAATVCTAFRRALLSSSKIALRYGALWLTLAPRTHTTHRTSHLTPHNSHLTASPACGRRRTTGSVSSTSSARGGACGPTCSPSTTATSSPRCSKPKPNHTHNHNPDPDPNPEPNQVLAGLLRAQPLSVISIRRCHSLSGRCCLAPSHHPTIPPSHHRTIISPSHRLACCSETLDTLPTGGTVRALMYAGLSTHLGVVHAAELR